jgi:acyl-CoA synthetase (AMP-forming)/AMP-acid ligase II
MTRQINLIGQHIQDQGGIRVAIYLPNSVELLTTLFACAFHNLTAILLPFGDSSTEVVISMIRRSAADTVVTAPGAFPFDAVVKSYPALRQLIWVVDPGSSHMDWDEVPEGVGGTVNVATWQDVVNEAPAEAGRVLPPLEGQGDARDVTVFWQGKTGNSALEEMIRFTSANLIAGIAGQLQALPSPRRFGPEDLFLPADSLASTFTLTLTLAALYSNASVAFNSVAEKAADLTAATRGIAPTVIVATPSALLQTHEATTKTILSSFVARQVHWLQTRTLTQNGVMPLASLLTRYNDSLRPAAGSTPGKLRLIFTADRAGAGTPPLSSSVLSDLRIYTGARVLYALTAAKVAGAAVQTAFYDYRATDDGEGGWSHFGSPLPSTEVVLRDVAGHKNSERESRGEVSVCSVFLSATPPQGFGPSLQRKASC